MALEAGAQPQVQGEGSGPWPLLQGKEGRRKLEAKQSLAEGTGNQQRKSPKLLFISCFRDAIDLLIILIMVTFCILLITENAKIIPTAESQP